MLTDKVPVAQWTECWPPEPKVVRSSRTGDIRIADEYHLICVRIAMVFPAGSADAFALDILKPLFNCFVQQKRLFLIY